jgi:hypothetical protein
MTAEQTATPQEVAAAIFNALNDRDNRPASHREHPDGQGHYERVQPEDRRRRQRQVTPPSELVIGAKMIRV